MLENVGQVTGEWLTVYHENAKWVVSDFDGHDLLFWDVQSAVYRFVMLEDQEELRRITEDYMEGYEYGQLQHF